MTTWMQKELASDDYEGHKNLLKDWLANEKADEYYEVDLGSGDPDYKYYSADVQKFNTLREAVTAVAAKRPDETPVIHAYTCVHRNVLLTFDDKQYHIEGQQGPLKRPVKAKVSKDTAAKYCLD